MKKLSMLSIMVRHGQVAQNVPVVKPLPREVMAFVSPFKHDSRAENVLTKPPEKKRPV
jgi:hypothetical protein